MKKNNIRRNDFLQIIHEAKIDGNDMTIEEIAAQAFLFLLAGFETSSSVATFAVYEMAINLDMQDRVRTEINEVLKKHDDKLTYDSIFEMKYLDMIFKETLRKYPVLDMQIRYCVKDYQVTGTDLVIPEKTMVFVSSGALHHDERFFENPDKFDPERFLPENEKNIQSYAYIPFSEGPRICIGSRFGIMQTKIILINIIRNFKLSPCDKTPIPMKFVPNHAFQSPQGGMWLKLKKL